MSDADWRLVTNVVIAIGCVSLVVLEVVRLTRGTARWTRRTGELWFGPLRRRLAERKNGHE